MEKFLDGEVLGNPVAEARRNTQAAEKLANELKQALEHAKCPLEPLLPINAVADIACDDSSAEPKQRMTPASNIDSSVNLDECEECEGNRENRRVNYQMDDLRRRMLQQLEVEKEMRGCVEAVLSKERAHSRKLQHLLDNAHCEIRRLNKNRSLTQNEAYAIKSAHEAAVGRERSDAAMAVKEIKSISERALLDHSSAWDAERSKLNDEIHMLRGKEREVDELHHQIAVLEGALKASQKEAEIAAARTRAETRIHLRKVKASACAHAQSEVQEIAHENTTLALENSKLTARVSDLEKLNTQIQKHLASARCELKDAGDQAKAYVASQRTFEAMCEDAASEIRLLRSEVQNLKMTMNARVKAGTERKVDAEITTRTQKANIQALTAQDMCRTVMVRILNMLNPDRVSPFVLSAMPVKGTAAHDLLDTTGFEAFKMRMNSSLELEESDIQKGLAWLDTLLGYGLHTLRQAQDGEAHAVSKLNEVHAEMSRALLAARSEIQLHQDTIHCLEVSLKERDLEVGDARQRLQQASASAHNLAGTLAAQECEILRLQESLQKVTEKSTTVELSAVGGCESSVAVQTQRATGNDMCHTFFRSQLQHCKDQLDARDCRISELREALKAASDGKGAPRQLDIHSADASSFAEKLQRTEAEMAMVCQKLRAAQDEATSQRTECLEITHKVTEVCVRLRSEAVFARCALRKLQEQGWMVDSPKQLSNFNIPQTMENPTPHEDAQMDLDSTATAATHAIHDLVAALEHEHNQVLNLDLNVNKPLGKDMRSLRDSLCRLYTGLYNGSLESQGTPPSSCASFGTAAEEVAALLPIINGVTEATAALQVKFHHSSCGLNSMKQHAHQLEAALQDSQNQVDKLQHSLRLQLQQFHQSLHSVKADTEAAQTSNEKSKTQLAALEQALLLAQEMEAIRSQELTLCQDSLESCNVEVEDLKMSLAALQKERDMSNIMVSDLQTELKTTNEKFMDLQGQLERARAATARAKLTTQRSSQKNTRQKDNFADRNFGPNTACHISADTVDVSVFVQQLDVAQKRLTKAVRDKTEMGTELKQMQERYQKLEAVHTKVCERRAAADLQNKKLCTQVGVLQKELQCTLTLKTDQQDKLAKTEEQLDAMKESLQQGMQDRQLWLSQLSSAEKLAEDSRTALLRDHAHCGELYASLASARSDNEALKHTKAALDSELAETRAELAAAQQSLRACESMLQSASHCNVIGSSKDESGEYLAENAQVNPRTHKHSEKAPLCPSTSVNSAACCKASFPDDQDAKSVRIQQLRETLVAVTSEKACLAETLQSCQTRIAQLELQATCATSRPFQDHKCTSPCLQEWHALEDSQLACIQTSRPLSRQSTTQPLSHQIPLAFTSVASQTDIKISSKDDRILPSNDHCVFSSPCSQITVDVGAQVNMNESECNALADVNSRRLHDRQLEECEQLDRARQGQVHEGRFAADLQHQNQHLLVQLQSVRADHSNAGCLIESLESTCADLHDKLRKLECQSSSEIKALQELLSCARQAEEVECAEKQRLRDHVEASCQQAGNLQEDVAKKCAQLIHIEAELAKLQRDKVEDKATIDALSNSVNNMRMDAQKAVLRAASKEEELQKLKNLLIFNEADLSAKTGKLNGLEAARSQLQERFLSLSEEFDLLKGENSNLKNDIRGLQSSVKAAADVELQLGKNLEQQREKAQDLVRELMLKTSLLETKSLELTQLLTKMQVTEEHLEKAQLELQDARLQVSNTQKDRAKAQEQSAADFKALVDARKQIVALKRLISDLQAKSRRQAVRPRGKTLADVYRGDNLRRRNGGQEVEFVAGDPAESPKEAEAAFCSEIEQKNLEIMELKQQLAGVTEELAMAACAKAYSPLLPSTGYRETVLKQAHVDARPGGNHEHEEVESSVMQHVQSARECGAPSVSQPACKRVTV